MQDEDDEEEEEVLEEVPEYTVDYRQRAYFVAPTQPIYYAEVDFGQQAEVVLTPYVVAFQVKMQTGFNSRADWSSFTQDGAGTEALIEVKLCSTHQALSSVQAEGPDCVTQRISAGNVVGFERGALFYGDYERTGKTADHFRYMRIRNLGGGDDSAYFLGGLELRLRYSDGTLKTVYRNPAINRWVLAFEDDPNEAQHDVYLSVHDTAVAVTAGAHRLNDLIPAPPLEVNFFPKNDIDRYGSLVAGRFATPHLSLDKFNSKIIYEFADPRREGWGYSNSHDGFTVYKGLSIFRHFTVTLRDNTHWYFDTFHVTMFRPGDSRFINNGHCYRYEAPGQLEVLNAQQTWDLNSVMQEADCSDSLGTIVYDEM